MALIVLLDFLNGARQAFCFDPMNVWFGSRLYSCSFINDYFSFVRLTRGFILNVFGIEDCIFGLMERGWSMATMDRLRVRRPRAGVW